MCRQYLPFLPEGPSGFTWPGFSCSVEDGSEDWEGGKEGLMVMPGHRKISICGWCGEEPHPEKQTHSGPPALSLTHDVALTSSSKTHTQK